MLITGKLPIYFITPLTSAIDVERFWFWLLGSLYLKANKHKWTQNCISSQNLASIKLSERCWVEDGRETNYGTIYWNTSFWVIQRRISARKRSVSFIHQLLLQICERIYRMLNKIMFYCCWWFDNVLLLLDCSNIILLNFLLFHPGLWSISHSIMHVK